MATMTFYSGKELEQLKKSLRVSVAVICVIAVAATAFGITLCALTDAGNAALFRALVTCVFVVAGWAAIAVAFMRVVPAVRKVKFLKRMLYTEKSVYRGIYAGQGEQITLFNRAFREFVLDGTEGKTVLYIEAGITVPLREGAAAVCLAADRIVYSAEAEQ